MTAFCWVIPDSASVRDQAKTWTVWLLIIMMVFLFVCLFCLTIVLLDVKYCVLSSLEQKPFFLFAVGISTWQVHSFIYFLFPLVPELRVHVIILQDNFYWGKKICLITTQFLNQFALHHCGVTFDLLWPKNCNHMAGHFKVTLAMLNSVVPP